MTKRTLAEIEAYLASWPERSPRNQARDAWEDEQQRKKERAEFAKIGIDIDAVLEAWRKRTEWCMREYERIRAEGQDT